MSSTRERVTDQDYSKSAMHPEFLKNKLFTNCKFTGCFFGLPRGIKGKIDFKLLNVKFKNCSFENANFKGVVGLNLSFFDGPIDLALAKHLPKSMMRSVEASPDGVSKYTHKRLAATPCRNLQLNAKRRRCASQRKLNFG